MPEISSTESGQHARTAKRAQTQWAAQFLAAAELVRRGYTVSFTMGNHTPDADMMVGAPSGKQFWVDVKGLSSKSAWLVRNKPHHLNLYYVLVYVAPSGRSDDRFFVLTQDETNRLIERYQEEHRSQGTSMPGFNWSDPGRVVPHDWDKLPR